MAAPEGQGGHEVGWEGRCWGWDAHGEGRHGLFGLVYNDNAWERLWCWTPRVPVIESGSKD